MWDALQAQPAQDVNLTIILLELLAHNAKIRILDVCFVIAQAVFNVNLDII